MYTKLNKQKVLELFKRTYEARKEKLFLEEDGVWEKEIFSPIGQPSFHFKDYISSDKAAKYAEQTAILYKEDKKEEYLKCVKACIDHIKQNCVMINGTYVLYLSELHIFPHSWYIWLPMYAALTIIDDRDNMKWLAEAIKSWPYDYDKHMWYMTIAPATKREPKVHNHAMNMMTEPSVAAWLVGYAVGDGELMNRAKDCIEKFVLPNQREDGLFNYDYERVYGAAPYTVLTDNPHNMIGPMEYNYSQVVAVNLARLLPYEYWRPILTEALKKHFEAITYWCRRPDGSVYAFVHWGWRGLWESSVYYIYQGLMLNKYCGVNCEQETASALYFAVTYNMDHEVSDLVNLPSSKKLLQAVYEGFDYEVAPPKLEDVLVTFSLVQRFAKEEDVRLAADQYVRSLWEASGKQTIRVMYENK